MEWSGPGQKTSQGIETRTSMTSLDFACACDRIEIARILWDMGIRSGIPDECSKEEISGNGAVLFKSRELAPNNRQ